MLAQIVRAVAWVLDGLLLGAVPGALYAALVGAVHLSVYGRWDDIPGFAVHCVVIAALVGLLARIAWALSGDAVGEGEGGRHLPSGGWDPSRTAADSRG